MRNLPILLLLFTILSFSFNATKALHGVPVVPQKASSYLQKHQVIAVEEMHRMGIPASIKIAQAMLESSYGESKLAQNAFNHFGLKCKDDWTGQSMEYTDDETDECFRAYFNELQSYQDHSNFLRYHYRAFYDHLFDSQTKDYRTWAEGLQAGGYANNPNYAESLIGIIERYELQHLDELSLSEVMDYHHVFPLVIEADSLMLFEWVEEDIP